MAIQLEADVAVLGGGPAGIAAALAAREEGLDVVLVERYGFMGGMATAGMLGSICGFYGKNDNGRFLAVGGIAARLMHKLSDLEGLGLIHEMMGKTYVIPYDIQAFKFACDDMVEEAGIRLILHAWATSAQVENGVLRNVQVHTKEGAKLMKAKVFIDATGDGDIAAAAGAQFTLNPKQLQLPSTIFTVANVDQEKAKSVTAAVWADLIVKARELGYRLPRVSGSVRNLPLPGLTRLNVTLIRNKNGTLNGVDYQDLTFAEVEGRKQVREYFRFLKNYVPGFEESFIAEIAPQVGIRETRKILGEYVLTEEDVFGNFMPYDVIGLNTWPIELHSGADHTIWEFIPNCGYHGIPFRCMQPVGLKNLLIAGRCISATHRAQSSVRVMGPAMVMGEAGGVAAAMMVNNHLEDSRNLNMTSLQDKLVQRGAILHIPFNSKETKS